MKPYLHAILLLISTAMVECFAVPGPVVWWKLLDIVDARTVRIQSDEGEKTTITLAGIGKAKDEKATVDYIRQRLTGMRLSVWPLSSSETNRMSRPMCLFIRELPPGHRGMVELNHYPMLNEELLIKGLVQFRDVSLPYDEGGLRARLYRASTYAK